MLKPSDLTKAELLQVVEMLAEAANEYYLDRALGRIEMQRNDAHYARCRKLIDEEQKHYAAYFDLLRPYEGKRIVAAIDKDKLAKLMCLETLGYSAKDIEIITPEQYEAEFGGDVDG